MVLRSRSRILEMGGGGGAKTQETPRGQGACSPSKFLNLYVSEMLYFHHFGVVLRLGYYFDYHYKKLHVYAMSTENCMSMPIVCILSCVCKIRGCASPHAPWIHTRVLFGII